MSRRLLIEVPSDGRTRYGFIDTRGQVVIAPEFDGAHNFREERAGVNIAGKGWGLVDTAGQWIVDPVFDEVGSFSEGLCAVLTKQQAWDSPERAGAAPGAQGRTWGFVDAKGVEVIPPKFKQQFALGTFPYFSEGLCAVPNEAGTAWGYIDRGGEMVIPARFAFGLPFSDGLAAVEEKPGRWGYIDKTGSFVFASRWQEAWPFVSGVAAVKTKGAEKPEAFSRFPEARASIAERRGLWGTIDRTGAYVRLPSFKHDSQHAPIYPADDHLHLGRRPLEFHDGLALVRSPDKKWGYMDVAGGLRVEPVYEKAGFFSEGLAAVRRRVKGELRWGIIDTTGNVVVEHCIEVMEPHMSVFRDGLILAGVTHHNQSYWGYMDRTGTFVIRPDLVGARPFVDGIAQVWGGYIDTAGNPIWSRENPT